MLTRVGNLDSSQTRVANFTDLRLDLTWAKVTCDLSWHEEKLLDLTWGKITWLDLTWWKISWLDLRENDLWLDFIWGKMTCDLTWFEGKWLDSTWGKMTCDLTWGKNDLWLGGKLTCDLTWEKMTWLQHCSLSSKSVISVIWSAWCHYRITWNGTITSIASLVCVDAWCFAWLM